MFPVRPSKGPRIYLTWRTLHSVSRWEKIPGRWCGKFLIDQTWKWHTSLLSTHRWPWFSHIVILDCKRNSGKSSVSMCFQGKGNRLWLTHNSLRHSLLLWLLSISFLLAYRRYSFPSQGNQTKPSFIQRLHPDEVDIDILTCNLPTWTIIMSPTAINIYVQITKVE